MAFSFYDLSSNVLNHLYHKYAQNGWSPANSGTGLTPALFEWGSTSSHQLVTNAIRFPTEHSPIISYKSLTATIQWYCLSIHVLLHTCVLFKASKSVPAQYRKHMFSLGEGTSQTQFNYSQAFKFGMTALQLKKRTNTVPATGNPGQNTVHHRAIEKHSSGISK